MVVIVKGIVWYPRTSSSKVCCCIACDIPRVVAATVSVSVVSYLVLCRLYLMVQS